MWDWPSSPYPNARWGTDFQRWIKPFYVFLLLKTVHDVPGSVALNVIRSTREADDNSLKQFLDQIASDSYPLRADYRNAPWGMSGEQHCHGQETTHDAPFLIRVGGV